MSKILDTSIEGYRKVGIILTEDQLHDIGFLNCPYVSMRYKESELSLKSFPFISGSVNDISSKPVMHIAIFVNKTHKRHS